MEPNQNTTGMSSASAAEQNMAAAPAQNVTAAPAQGATGEPLPKDNMMAAPVKEKKKGGSGMLIGLILCLLLAAGGIGFGVWMMMDGNTQKDAMNQQISALKKQNSELQEKISNDASGDSWDKFSRNLATQSMYIMGYYSHYNGTGNEQYVAYALKDTNGHLVITDAGNNMNVDNPVILELDDVLSVYCIRVGNGSVPYFYIVDLDGSVSRIDISENSNRQLEKVGEYTKIATVLEAANLEALLVDIDGNIYKSL